MEVSSTITEVQKELCEAKLRLQEMSIIVNLCQQRERIDDFEEELRRFIKLMFDTALLNKGK